MPKRTWIAYILWLIGGGWGLHLLYLHRDRQAFLWFATGGGFLLGYLRDLKTISRYVSEANEGFGEDASTSVNESSGHRNEYPSRSFSILRLGASCVFGLLLATLLQYCIPEEWLEFTDPGFNLQFCIPYLIHCLGPLGAFIGVHMVANIGKEKCSAYFPFYTTAAVASLYVLFRTQVNLTWVTVISAAFSAWKGRRMRTRCEIHKRNQRGFFKRFVLWSVLATAYMCLLVSVFYFNASITTEDGEVVKVRDSINHFFQSEMWENTKEVFWQLYERYKQVGWTQMYNDLVTYMDPQGEIHARKVMGVNSDCTEEELKRQYKVLVRKWHPDKHKDNKERAEKEFMQIQDAYETLSKIHAKRSQRHKRDQTS